MGKSRTSPLSKTGGGAGGLSIGGGSGGNIGTVTSGGRSASFAPAGDVQQGQTVASSLNTVDGASVTTADSIAQAQQNNNANFSASDSQDYHQLYNGRKYYTDQNLTIDQQFACMAYTDDGAEPGSKFSLSQNMNYDLRNGNPLSQTESDTYKYLMQSMHNLGYNLNLQHYDHADFLNNLVSMAGGKGSYENMTESDLKKLLVGKTYKDRGLTSTTYDNFSKAGSLADTFTSRAVKIEYRAKASAQAMMPGNGPGGPLCEILLSSNNNYHITDIKFDKGRKSRYKGGYTYGAKSVTMYVDVD